MAQWWQQSGRARELLSQAGSWLAPPTLWHQVRCLLLYHCRRLTEVAYSHAQRSSITSGRFLHTLICQQPPVGALQGHVVRCGLPFSLPILLGVQPYGVHIICPDMCLHPHGPLWLMSRDSPWRRHATIRHKHTDNSVLPNYFSERLSSFGMSMQ